MNICACGFAMLLAFSMFACKKTNDNNTSTSTTNQGGTNPGGGSVDTTTCVSTYACDPENCSLKGILTSGQAMVLFLSAHLVQNA
jgi:hypothetical protein